LESPARQVAGFVAKFDPKVAKVIRASRAALRKRFPTANELVYDNYNFFVIGFSATERSSDCLVSLVANAKGVGLSFYYGATLPDPANILLGSGNQNRFIRLESAATLARPEVEALLRAATAQAKTPLPTIGRRRIIVRSVSAKQRPRAANFQQSAIGSQRSAMFADGFDDPIQRQVFLPLVAGARVIAGARAIQAQEPRKAICTQFTFQYVESVPLELLVGQLVDGDHSPCSLLQDTGFRTGIRGAPTPRAACLIKRSSVDSNTSAPAESAAAKWRASNGP